MLSLQRAQSAAGARAGKARLVRTVPAAPITHIQQCYLHGKGAETAEAGQQASSTSRSVDSADTGKATPDAVKKIASSGGEEFWRKISMWEDVSTESFMSYRWSVSQDSSAPYPIYISLTMLVRSPILFRGGTNYTSFCWPLSPTKFLRGPLESLLVGMRSCGTSSMAFPLPLWPFE